MIKRLVIFLIRKRLKLKKYEPFRFTNQKSPYDFYYFTKTALIKYESKDMDFVNSGVSLNWLLNDKCKIESTKDILYLGRIFE